MANKSVDGRVFTRSKQQAYIFSLAKKVITNNISINDVKPSLQKSVNRIVQSYYNKKITLSQINRKCYYNVNNGHINSNGYTFVNNANNSYNCYQYYFYIDPLQHNPFDVANSIINNGFNINNYAGFTCNNFKNHPNYLILKVNTNVRPTVHGAYCYHHSTVIAPQEVATVMIPDNLVK